MNSEQKYYLGETELKVGQVWETSDGSTEGRIIGFNSEGTAIIEIIKSGPNAFYDLKEILPFSNPSWILQPEKKKVEYRVFKSRKTDKVFVFSDESMEHAEKSAVDWLTLSPRMKYEYVER